MFHATLFKRLEQALFIGLPPRVVDQDHARFLGTIIGNQIFRDGFVDIFINRRNAEDIVFLGTVFGDPGSGSPRADERDFLLVHIGHDGKGYRRIKAANDRRNAFALGQFTGRDQTLARVAFIITRNKFKRLAKNAALGIDLVNRKGNATRNGFARFGRLSAECGNKAKLHSVFCTGIMGRQGGGKHQRSSGPEKGGTPRYFPERRRNRHVRLPDYVSASSGVANWACAPNRHRIAASDMPRITIIQNQRLRRFSIRTENRIASCIRRLHAIFA